MAHGRCRRALERLLGGLWRSVGALGEVLGVMLAPKMAAKSGRYRKKYGSKRQAVPEWFFDGSCVADKQPGRPQSLYLSLGIPLSNSYRRLQHRHRNLFVLGGSMGQCWPSESRKISFQGESGFWRRVQKRSWEFPRGFCKIGIFLL